MFVQTRAILKKVKNTRCMPKIDIHRARNENYAIIAVQAAIPPQAKKPMPHRTSAMMLQTMLTNACMSNSIIHEMTEVVNER